MFKIVHEPFGPFTQVKMINSKTKEWFAFIPEFSATINGLALRKGDHVYQLIDGCDNYESLISVGKEKFRGSKLFPFPNRIKDGAYSFDGMKFQLRKNFPGEGHAIHGLVLDKAFKITNEEILENSAKVQLAFNYEGDDTGYLFNYKLMVEFTLDTTGFSCTTKIENTDNTAIPLGDGWHPYFKLENKVDELLIKIPSKQVVEVDDRMIPTGSLVFDDRFWSMSHITNTAFDTCYKLADTEGIASLEVYNPKKDINLVVWQRTGKNKYNYLQIYTPPTRDCIAVEPMTCMPDAFNNKNGLIVLEPHQNINFVFGVKLN